MEDRVLPSSLVHDRAARPEVELRAILEPLFVKHGVDVVFTGTSTSTNGSSRRRASTIFSSVAPRSSAPATRAGDR